MAEPGVETTLRGYLHGLTRQRSATTQLLVQSIMIAVTVVSPDPARVARIASTELPADLGPLARGRT
jgi:hypothetical protein